MASRVKLTDACLFGVNGLWIDRTRHIDDLSNHREVSDMEQVKVGFFGTECRSSTPVRTVDIISGRWSRTDGNREGIPEVNDMCVIRWRDGLIR